MPHQKRSFHVIFSLLICAIALWACDGIVGPENPLSGTPLLATSARGGTAGSTFYGAAAAGERVYTAGLLRSGSLAVSDTLTVSGSMDYNCLLVAFDKDGEPQWAACPTAATALSRFAAVAASADHNAVYAVGFCGLGTLDLGNSISPLGAPAGSRNMLIVKYSLDGTPLWARTVTGPAAVSVFYSVAVGSDGIYAVAEVWGTGTWNVGNSKQVVTTNGGNNLVVVKYDANGLAQWAAAPLSGPSITGSAIAANDTGVYVAGEMQGPVEADFGNNVKVAGYQSNAEQNPLLVKYSLAGVAQWAVSAEYNAATVVFQTITVDDGAVYVTGEIEGISGVRFGNGVETIGTAGTYNGVIVKYSLSGGAQWCRAIRQGNMGLYYKCIRTDAASVYVCGGIDGPGTVSFGDSVSLQTFSNPNPVIIRYGKDGVAKWARSTTNPIPGTGWFFGAAINEGELYAVGQMANGVSDFGAGVRATALASGDNFLLVKYLK